MKWIRNFLIKLLGPIFAGMKFSDLLPERSFEPILLSYLDGFVKTWWWRGFLLLMASYFLSLALHNDYFIEGAKEHFAPLWWNLLTVAGIVWLSLANIFRQFNCNKIADRMTKTSKSILTTASEIGAFSCGLLSATFLLIVAFEPAGSFKEYFAATFGLFLFCVVIFLNLIVWAVAYCLNDDVETPPFFVRLNEYRACSIAVYALLILTFLYITAHAKVHSKANDCPPQNAITNASV